MTHKYAAVSATLAIWSNLLLRSSTHTTNWFFVSLVFVGMRVITD